MNYPSAVFYTERERTEKKYTVKDAIQAATKIIKDRFNEAASKPVLTSVQKLQPETALTLPELNCISDKILADTRQAGFNIKRHAS